MSAAQLDAGRRDDALRTQQEAVHLRPDDPALRDQLRQMEDATQPVQESPAAVPRRGTMR